MQRLRIGSCGFFLSNGAEVPAAPADAGAEEEIPFPEEAPPEELPLPCEEVPDSAESVFARTEALRQEAMRKALQNRPAVANPGGSQAVVG